MYVSICYVNISGAEKFHILPEKTKEYFLGVFRRADAAAERKEKEIISEFEHVKGTLSIDVEKAENERLLSEAVA
jgi:hypothetical protein